MDMMKINKSTLGSIFLLILGGISIAFELYDFFKGMLPINILMFDAGVGAFGLYIFGSIFFDYSVTFRTTINSAAPLGMRIFQSSIGFLLWGISVWSLY
jgi:hypothetical protein